MTTPIEQDPFDDETPETRERAPRSRRIVRVAANVAMAIVVLAGFALSHRVYAQFTGVATEATLLRNTAILGVFQSKQIAEMLVHTTHWKFRTYVTAANITENLITVYQELAKRHSYREMGFTWEPRDTKYGRVRQLLDFVEGTISPTEGRIVLENSAYVTYCDMKTDRQIRTLVPDGRPGAALEYAAYAALAKNGGKAGQIYKEMREHRDTMKAIARIANVIWQGPERSAQIAKVMDFYGKLIETNEAELQSVRASNEALTKALASYREELAKAGGMQADYERRKTMKQYEAIEGYPFEHLVRPAE